MLKKFFTRGNMIEIALVLIAIGIIGGFISVSLTLILFGLGFDGAASVALRSIFAMTGIGVLGALINGLFE